MARFSIAFLFALSVTSNVYGQPNTPEEAAAKAIAYVIAAAAADDNWSGNRIVIDNPWIAQSRLTASAGSPIAGDSGFNPNALEIGNEPLDRQADDNDPLIAFGVGFNKLKSHLTREEAAGGTKIVETRNHTGTIAIRVPGHLLPLAAFIAVKVDKGKTRLEIYDRIANKNRGDTGWLDARFDGKAIVRTNAAIIEVEMPTRFGKSKLKDERFLLFRVKPNSRIVISGATAIEE